MRSGCACSLLWWSWWLEPRCSSSFVCGGPFIPQRWQLQSPNAMSMVCERGVGRASGGFWLVSPFPPPLLEWHSDVLSCHLWRARILESRGPGLSGIPALFRAGESAATEPGFPRLDEKLLTQAIPNPCLPVAGITWERHFSRPPLCVCALGKSTVHN
jgi:hypothetical protein